MRWSMSWLRLHRGRTSKWAGGLVTSLGLRFGGPTTTDLSSAACRFTLVCWVALRRRGRVAGCPLYRERVGPESMPLYAYHVTDVVGGVRLYSRPDWRASPR